MLRTILLRRILASLSAFVLLSFPPEARSYSVLTHEAIIDTLWIDAIQPVLLKRFPDASEEQLREAHGYAYGGCLIQDLGYYPFGSHFFSDLVHYVRSADFLPALLDESRDSMSTRSHLARWRIMARTSSEAAHSNSSGAVPMYESIPTIDAFSTVTEEKTEGVSSGISW